ncbi:MAG: CvpA family protein [Clostridia bacterium]|nr:CvpA family protein [Clostridia bacterium]
MNWSDLLVIAIIGGFGLLGLSRGFIYSLFRLLSFFVAAIISVKFYPLVADILMKTALYTNIKASILKNLLFQQQSQTPAIDDQAKQIAASKADEFISGLHLPGFLSDMLGKEVVKSFPNPSKLVDMSQIMNVISEHLAKLAIDIISVIVLYIVVRIALTFLRVVLQGIAKLPVFKQMDKIGGLAFGAVEGLLTIYVVFAVLLVLHANPQFRGAFEAIDNSLVAKFFYENNLIIDWMFPTKG